MRRKTKASVVALTGVLAALAASLLFLGGVVPFAAIACPVLASLVLIPVYTETGKTMGFVWYLAVSLLGLLLAPDKEAAILFVFFGYYPVLKKYIGRLKNPLLKWVLKLAFVNAAVFAAYSLMIFVLGLEQVRADFASMERVLLAACLILANISFVVYDFLIDRLEIFYHLRLRPKLIRN